MKSFTLQHNHPHKIIIYISYLIPIQYITICYNLIHNKSIYTELYHIINYDLIS